MRSLLLLLLASTCLAAAAAPKPSPLQRTVTITDAIGVAWQNELVHYTLDFPQGALKGKATALVQAGKTSLVSQVSDIAFYDDGSVQSMAVWFQATVAPYTSVTYTITAGKVGPSDAGVKVQEVAGAVELTTTAPQPLGIRLVKGSARYDWPIPATQVPGPIQALLLPSGRVTGEGKFAVPFKVRSYTSEITAAGPLFAEARVRYQFDNGYWTFTARVEKGCPVVIISEQLDTGWSTQKAADFDRFYTFTLNAGKQPFTPAQAYLLGRNDKPEYQDAMPLTPQDIIKEVMWQPSTSGTNCSGFNLASKADAVDYYLIAWACWSARVGVGLRYQEPGKEAVGFVALDTPYWRNQMAMRFRRTPDGVVTVNLPLQVYDQAWETDGYGRTSPNATGKTLDVPDTTARRKWGIMLSPAEDEKAQKLVSLLTASAKLGAWPLDEVKDWQLSWPDPKADAIWAEESTPEAKAIMAQVDKWIAAKRTVGNAGIYSMHDYFLVSQWPSKQKGIQDVKDILDDPTKLSAADRKKLRSQMAYVAYIMHSTNVFPWGVGSHLGNPNMSIMAMNTRTFSSGLIKDHPLFTRWGAWTVAFMQDYVDRFTRESGAAYECPSYTLGVTLKQLADANAVLREAGIGDAFASPRFAKSLRFTMDWLLPQDLRFNNKRTIMPVGNTSYQSVPPDFAEQVVRYYQERDPQLAGQFQWFANQTLPNDKQLAIVKDVVPALKSEWYKDYGVVFRHGFGTPYETYLHLMAGNCLGHYETTDHMVYTLYAKGHPINLHFGNGYFPMYGRPWLRNGISVDHRVHWAYERLYAGIQTAAFSPYADYLHAAQDIDELLPKCGEYPPDYGKPDPDPLKFTAIERIPTMTWHRQILFLKDADPKGPNYFVVRDNFGGKPTKPTDDTFWFLANSMTREGNVYHFDGQLPVDMDVFVNSPAGVEPETGKFGHVQQPYSRLTGDDLKYYPNKVRREDQLFLRLKQPAGGGYLVVLYPRLKGIDAPAAYTSLAEYAVKVDTPLSTDYLLLNAYPATVQADGIVITGTAVAVRRFKDGKLAVVNTDGPATIRVAGKTITGHGPFTVTLTNGTAETNTQSEGATVEVK